VGGRVVAGHHFEDLALEAGVEVGVEEDLAVKADQSEDEFGRVLEGEVVEVLEVRSAFVEQLGLYLDEVVAVQVVHPADDLMNYLPVILDLLIENTHPVDLDLCLLCLLLHAFELKLLLHRCRPLLYLVPCLLNAKIGHLFVDGVPFVVKKVLFRVLPNVAKQTGRDHYLVVVDAKEVVEECFVGVAGE
jgi:hypothetical protein